MKKNLILLIIAVIGIGLSSCSDEPGQETNENSFQPRQDIVLTKSEAEVNESAKTFAYNLIKPVDACAKELGQDNWLVSPLSASQVLGMMANGAQGETLTELCDLLAVEPSQIADMNSYYKNMAEQLKKVDNTTKINIASALFADNEFPIKPDFITTCSDWYGAKVQNLDFTDPTAIKTVNQWFEKQTNGIIQEMIKPTVEKTCYVIGNALYFDATWPSPFSSESIEEFLNDFPSSTNSVKRTLMRKKGFYNYARIGDFEACERTYGNGAFSLVIMLPIEKTLDECLANLTQESFEALLDDFDINDLQLQIPKWEISNELNFEGILHKSGHENVLGNMPNYSSVSDKQLSVTMTQKNYIKVNEKGTIIASGSSSGNKDAADIPEKNYLFNANHPFLYLVREKSTGAILLIGKIGKL